MPYCTYDDIKKFIPEINIIQLTDDANSGAVDTAKVNEAIGYAEQLIDGYLRGRYTVPLSPVPQLIKHIAIDIAVFALYSRRFELDMPETMMQRFKNSIKMLEQIQKGLLRIGAETETLGYGHAQYKSNKSDADRIFTKTHLEAF